MHSIYTTFPFGLGLKGIILLLTDHPLHPQIFFFFFGHAACGISVPQPGIEPKPHQ